MKIKTILLGILSLLAFASHAQDNRYSIAVGLGYYAPLLSAENISYPDAEYKQEIGAGISYFISADYALTRDWYVGLGFNGGYATAKFIKDPLINGEQIEGHLEAGALENMHFLLNVTYFPDEDGLQPYAKLGLGYFMNEVELGDIPLRLTDNVEKEIFPDYKSTGFGILPELGIEYNLLTLSVGYGLPFNELTGEDPEPEGYVSNGSIKSHSLQVNVAYRILLF